MTYIAPAGQLHPVFDPDAPDEPVFHVEYHFDPQDEVPYEEFPEAPALAQESYAELYNCRPDLVLPEWNLVPLFPAEAHAWLSEQIALAHERFERAISPNIEGDDSGEVFFVGYRGPRILATVMYGETFRCEKSQELLAYAELSDVEMPLGVADLLLNSNRKPIPMVCQETVTTTPGTEERKHCLLVLPNVRLLCLRRPKFDRVTGLLSVRRLCWVSSRFEAHDGARWLQRQAKS